MDSFFRSLNVEMPSSDCPSSDLGIQRCPFLRNINEPTNFDFSSPMSFAMPVRGAKGPIFEDGPNFDMAFRLFHGHDGVVPLSGRSFVHSENVDREPARPQFNPLAAKAATISLSSFGTGDFFGFGSFNEKFKNQKKSKFSKKENSSQGANSSHEALGNEWLYNGNCPIAKSYRTMTGVLQLVAKGANSSLEALGNEWVNNGNCPIAKSYRAVSGVLPLVAKVLQPPPEMKFKCPPAIVAARAALARTALVKTIPPQSLPSKVLVVGALGMAANVHLGMAREHTKKFSPSWFVAVHAAVPFIAMLSKSVLMPKTAMAFTIAASILGQFIGSRAERIRLKTIASKNEALVKTSASGSDQLHVVGVKINFCIGATLWRQPHFY